MKRSLMSICLSAVLSVGLCAGAQASGIHLKHQDQACTTCHTSKNAVNGNIYVVPDNQACMSCHGSFKDLAAQTKPKDPEDPNPHKSHHYGQNMSCTGCHAEHKESRVLCNDCHTFNFKQIR